MELEIYDIAGKKTGKKAKLNDAVFGVEPNEHAMYLDVKHHLANRRQGTAMTLEKSLLSGSTKKLHRQKGTGGSRKGSIKNPLFRGGARIFGPKPRTYSSKLNKKVSELARRSALTSKVKDGSVRVLSGVSIESPKTKTYQGMLDALEFGGNKKTLLVLSGKDDMVLLSARNIPGAKVTTARELNTYDILNCKGLLIAQDAIEQIETTLSK
jgi:large subunit ribosomal protein L4